MSQKADRPGDGSAAHSGVRGQYELVITEGAATGLAYFLGKLVSARGRKKYYLGKGIMQLIRRRNRRHNAAFPSVTDYIGCQGGGGAADGLRYGLFKMRFNGCEVIAVYNFLKLMGQPRDIRDIASDLEEQGLILMGGFGTRPDGIRRYLDDVLTGTWEKASLIPSEERASYDVFLAGVPAAILTFWNGERGWTIHTVTVERTGTGIRVYNRFTNQLTTEYRSIGAFLADARFPVRPVSLIIPSR